MSPRKRISIYTDGSCDTQTGDGGWAYLLAYKGHRKSASGFEDNTTNNRMELTAAVRALRALKEACDVTLITDSQYLKNAFTERWLQTWQENGWKTANRKPVKNQDLWLELLSLSSQHHIDWEWTRGHTGHEENEHVDRLALKARRDRRGNP